MKWLMNKHMNTMGASYFKINVKCEHICIEPFEWVIRRKRVVLYPFLFSENKM